MHISINQGFTLLKWWVLECWRCFNTDVFNLSSSYCQITHSNQVTFSETFIIFDDSISMGLHVFIGIAHSFVQVHFGLLCCPVVSRVSQVTSAGKAVDCAVISNNGYIITQTNSTNYYLNQSVAHTHSFLASHCGAPSIIDKGWKFLAQKRTEVECVKTWPLLKTRAQKPHPSLGKTSCTTLPCTLPCFRISLLFPQMTSLNLILDGMS